MRFRPLVGLVVALASAAGFGARPVPAAPTYAHYLGALHEHSGFSDGSPGTTPADYFASAKAFGLDFLGSGEHSDNADVPITFNEGCLDPQKTALCADPSMDGLTRWDATLRMAREATTDTFTGFRGFEWTSDRFGHINVYFSRHDTNAKVDGGYATMETFWEWFLRMPLLGGGADGLATFNHPNDKKLDDRDPTKNWNDFAHVPAADPRMVGLEVFNGGKDYGSWFVRALDRGWHVGAVGAEDAHETEDEWGAPRWAKTVLIAAGRSAEALREAMLARRMYAVLDNEIRIEMHAGGKPMGARIGAPFPGPAVPITATVTGGGATLELVTNEGSVVRRAAAPSISYAAPPESRERYYFLRVLNAEGKAVAYSSPVWIRPGLGTERRGEWLAGDLHIHTTYSHDAWDPVSDDNTGPDEFYTLGHSVGSQFTVAASRGLDYLAITDHNDIRSQRDPGFGAHGVIPVHAYENSLRGHAQMLGARRIYDAGDESAASVEAMAHTLREDGGVFQINHPADGSVHFPQDADWGYGYDVVPDTVEVWNISPLWQPPMPSGSSQDDAIRFWEGWLDQGYRVAITGGSDNHWVSTTAVQGAGQPTTWVFATERSERGVLEALRRGRTFVSWQPPAFGGPQLIIEADVDGDGRFEATMGDTIRWDSSVRYRVAGAPPGAFVRLVSGGPGARHVATCSGVETPAFGMVSCEIEISLEPGARLSWVRAELVHEDARAERDLACDDALGGTTTYCRNALAILAMTSPMYIKT